MRIRTYHPRDLDALIGLTIATFGPFFEDHFRPQFGETIFQHQHGRWADDYRVQVPALHEPAANKHVAIAESDDGTILGYVAWMVDPDRRHGQVVILAVEASHRRERVGTALCQHAFEDMAQRNVDVVVIGTGGQDSFHAPARALYESLGCVPVHVAHYFKEL